MLRPALRLLPLRLIALSACAHRTPGEQTRRCVPATVDPRYARFGIVYTACEVEKAATPLRQSGATATERVDAIATMSSRSRSPSSSCSSAEVEFVVDEEGRVITESARVIRSTDAAYGESVLRALPALRFTPARKEGRPVRQLMRHGRAIGTTVVAVRGGGAPVRTARPPRC